MPERGITGEAQEQIVRSITSFALYGCPESHSAKTAPLVGSIGWLQVHHPAGHPALCLLNALADGLRPPSWRPRGGRPAPRDGRPPARRHPFGAPLSVPAQPLRGRSRRPPASVSAVARGSASMPGLRSRTPPSTADVHDPRRRAPFAAVDLARRAGTAKTSSHVHAHAETSRRSRARHRRRATRADRPLAPPPPCSTSAEAGLRYLQTTVRTLVADEEVASAIERQEQRRGETSSPAVQEPAQVEGSTPPPTSRSVRRVVVKTAPSSSSVSAPSPRELRLPHSRTRRAPSWSSTIAVGRSSGAEVAGAPSPIPPPATTAGSPP